MAVRYPADRRGMPIIMNDHEIRQRSGLCVADFMWLQHSLSWDEIPEAKKIAYLKGCGIRLDNWRSYSRLVRMVRRGAWRHLKNSPLWETHFKPMLELYLHGRSRTAA